MREKYAYLLFVLIGILFSIWFGGFTFYAAVVVPIGTDLIGTSEQGLVTQSVSNWLNGIGGLTLLGLGFLCFKVFPHRGMKRMWWILFISWLGLLGVHLILDRYISSGTYEVSDPREFYLWHRVYLWIHTIQWVAAIAFLFYLASHTSRKGSR